MAKTEKQINREKVLEAYAAAKVDLNELTQKVKDMQDEVVEVLKDCPDQKSETANALFSLRKFVTYEYSKKIDLKNAAIDADKEALKMMKKEEEESGVAEIISESFSPIVKVLKD